MKPLSRTLNRRALLAGAAALPLGWPAIVRGATTSCRDRTTADCARLDLVGNALHAGGQRVRLIGVAVGDPIYIRANRPLQDYATIATTWRANVVRISLHPGHWRADRTRALAALTREIGAARAVGLRVIVTWHAIGFPGHYVERPHPSWGLGQDIYDSDEALAADFWETIAAATADDPGIIFELWNEPAVDAKLWESTGQHWPLLKSLWTSLIGRIRKHSDAIVLVTGGRWAHDLIGVARDPVADDRVAYAWHCYPPADRGKPDRWHRSLDGLPQSKPVLVTEWGFCRNCPPHIRGSVEDFGQPFVRDVLEALHLHSTAWCWSPGAAPAMLTADGAPTEFGRFVKEYLALASRNQETAR